MTSMLFVTWDGGGNLPPMLMIALEVQSRGVSVRFLGHAGQRETIESAGLRFEQYRRAKPWSALEPRASLRGDLAYAAVFTDRGIGEDVVESIGREPVDRVLVDGLLVGALAALARSGIPYTILVHTLRSVMHTALLRGPLGLIMRLNGYRPDRLYARADAELVATEPSLDTGADRLPSSIHYTGAILPPTREASPDTAEPTVLVSLSTTYVDGQLALLQRIVDALAPVRARVVVTTGPAVDPHELRAPQNAHVHRFLPHGEVMATASLVIGHGGHGTTLLALAHGLPMLIIPTRLSFDQPAIAQVIAQHGLGLALTRRASVGRIRACAQELLSDPFYLAAARRTGDRIRGQSGAVRAADVLTDTTGSGRARG